MPRLSSGGNVNCNYFSPGTVVWSLQDCLLSLGPGIFASMGPFYLEPHWYKDKYNPGWFLAIFFF